MEDIFLKLMFNTQKKYMNFIVTFLSGRKKPKKGEKFAKNFHDKNEGAIHIRNLKPALI